MSLRFITAVLAQSRNSEIFESNKPSVPTSAELAAEVKKWTNQPVPQSPPASTQSAPAVPRRVWFDRD